MKNFLFFFLFLVCLSCNNSSEGDDDFKQKGFSTKSGSDVLFIYTTKTNPEKLKGYGENRAKKGVLTTIHFFNDYVEMPAKPKEMTDEKMKKYWVGTYTSPPKGKTTFTNSSEIDSSGHFVITGK